MKFGQQDRDNATLICINVKMINWLYFSLSQIVELYFVLFYFFPAHIYLRIFLRAITIHSFMVWQHYVNSIDDYHRSRVWIHYQSNTIWLDLMNFNDSDKRRPTCSFVYVFGVANNWLKWKKKQRNTVTISHIYAPNAFLFMRAFISSFE